MIQPVYAFSGDAEDSGKTITWDAYLPAIENVNLAEEPDTRNIEIPKKSKWYMQS